jgi:ABC-type uncharacterized transport system ATPase subunit
MQAVEVSHIAKYYADKVAVDNLSFNVAQNEIFSPTYERSSEQ